MPRTPHQPPDPHQPNHPGRQLKLRGVDGEVLPTSAARPKARRAAEEEDEISDLPQRADVERFSAVTRTCPACKKDVFDDVAACYHCGEYLDTSADRRGPPRWAIVVAGVLLLGLVLALVIRTF